MIGTFMIQWTLNKLRFWLDKNIEIILAKCNSLCFGWVSFLLNAYFSFGFIMKMKKLTYIRLVLE